MIVFYVGLPSQTGQSGKPDVLLTPPADQDTIEAAVTGVVGRESSELDKSRNVQNRRENEQ